MFKLAAYGLTLALCLGTAGLLANHRNSNQSAEARLAADGAFRDGLFLGRLAAKNGQPLSPPTARWSGKQDRASFTAGYRRGYTEIVARAVTDLPTRNQ
jgi:hypothetical protein